MESIFKSSLINLKSQLTFLNSNDTKFTIQSKLVDLVSLWEIDLQSIPEIPVASQNELLKLWSKLLNNEITIESLTRKQLEQMLLVEEISSWKLY